MAAGDVERRADQRRPAWPSVFITAAVCFASTCWQFTRAVDAHRLVDVRPGRTLLPLLLLLVVAVAVVARRTPARARWTVLVTAGVIAVLTAIVLPIVMNRAIDAGQPIRAWPLGWLVPVELHFRDA